MANPDLSVSELNVGLRSLVLSRFKIGQGRTASLTGICVLLIVVFSLLEPGIFPTARNFESMAFQMSEIGLLALAIGITMIGGGIDLSVSATANMAGIAAGLVVSAHTGEGTPAGILIVALGAAIAVGLTMGVANGGLVAYLNVHPILATLATMTIVMGLATGITNGATVFGQQAFTGLGSGLVLGIPAPLVLVVLAAAILAFTLHKSRFGFRLYLSGSNPIAASFSGIPVRRTLLMSYVASGVLAGISGIIILGRTNAANVDFGGSFVLLAVLVAVLGGINPYGGEGKILNVLLALMSVQILSTGINTVFAKESGSNFLKEASWGLLLLIILAVPALRTMRSSLRRFTETGPVPNTAKSNVREHHSVNPQNNAASYDAENYVLNAHSIDKSFGGIRALDNASLKVRAGTVHALVGENGSGKSTLTKVVSGVHQPDAGVIELCGETFEYLSPKVSSASGLQVIYQDLALFPDLTVAENIYLAADRVGVNRFINWGDAKAMSKDGLSNLGIDLNPNS